MKEDLDKIGEYAKYTFDEVEKVKEYGNVDIGNSVESYELGIGLIILVSLFLCLILC
jgi:uncharacterized membrane protein